MHHKQYKHIKIPFISKFKWISSLNYNHATQQLFAWDKSYLVTYDVVFYPPEDRAYFGPKIAEEEILSKTETELMPNEPILVPSAKNETSLELENFSEIIISTSNSTSPDSTTSEFNGEIESETETTNTTTDPPISTDSPIDEPIDEFEN